MHNFIWTDGFIGDNSCKMISQLIKRLERIVLCHPGPHSWHCHRQHPALLLGGEKKRKKKHKANEYTVVKIKPPFGNHLTQLLFLIHSERERGRERLSAQFFHKTDECDDGKKKAESRSWTGEAEMTIVVR